MAGLYADISSVMAQRMELLRMRRFLGFVSGVAVKHEINFEAPGL